VVGPPRGAQGRRRPGQHLRRALRRLRRDRGQLRRRPAARALGVLDEADRTAFCFDPRVIDWEQYVTTIHLPSVVAHARVKTTPGASNRQSRSARLGRRCWRPSATSPPSTSRTR
jgi:hypothetical protein